MTQVMKVSKTTYDVLITDNKNLSFSSELATHSIYNIFTVTVTTSLTINHNLGYVPKTWIFTLEGTAPNDFYRRIPQCVSGDKKDFYITTNSIVIEGSGIFRVIIFTRSPNP